MFNLLDLFSGIGGFSLGLERTGGFRTAAFCEIEPYAQAVLRKHWPEVPCYGDIKTLTAERLAADGIAVDAICGGFPCQDISVAGKGAGLDGARSGLWREYVRLIGELRPRWVIAENVAQLRTRGLDRVLNDLAAIGYDAEWHCVPASYVGAPHRRDRIWIVAYPHGEHDREAIPAAVELSRPANVEQWRDLRAELGRGDALPGASSYGGILRAVHGLPHRAHRLRCLGNAVVPQIPEAIGRAILAVERNLAERAASNPLVVATE